MVDIIDHVNYSYYVIEIIKSATYSRWFESLADSRAKARIMVRIDRLALGNAGDAKSVGEGVVELRIDYGPGDRVYFTRIERMMILLLCGGDKSSQERDIVKAKAIAEQWRM